MEENGTIKLDKKQKLENLEEENKKTGLTLANIHKQIVDFERGADYEEYNKMDDAEKETKFPKEFEMYKQKLAIEDKIINMSRMIKETATELYKEIDEKIENFEKEIKSTSDAIERLMEEIRVQNREIIELKEIDSYKNGDEETIRKVEELELELKKKIMFKNLTVRKLGKDRKKINHSEEYKKELVDEYGEQIKPVKEVVEPKAETQQEGQQTPETTGNAPQQEEQQASETPRANSNNNTRNRRQQPFNAVPIVDEPTNTQNKDESTKNEQEDKEAKLKQEFKELYDKAKKRKTYAKGF